MSAELTEDQIDAIYYEEFDGVDRYDIVMAVVSLRVERDRLKALNAEMLEVLEKIDTHFRNAPPKEVKEHVNLVLEIIWAVSAIVAKAKEEKT